MWLLIILKLINVFVVRISKIKFMPFVINKYYEFYWGVSSLGLSYAGKISYIMDKWLA
jgi:hypothetical protein